MSNERMVKQEQANELIASHQFEWCRARLLHALAGAAEQGVLDDVIDELFPQESEERLVQQTASLSERVLEHLLNHLIETGWMRPGHRMVP